MDAGVTEPADATRAEEPGLWPLAPPPSLVRVRCEGGCVFDCSDHRRAPRGLHERRARGAGEQPWLGRPRERLNEDRLGAILAVAEAHLVKPTARRRHERAAVLAELRAQ